MDVTLTATGLGTLSLGAAADRTMHDVAPDQEAIRLVTRAQAGDREAFGTLIELHHRAAHRVALIATGNAADADEVVQEACLVAWQRLPSLQQPGAFRSWLLRIAWRKAVDRRRSVKALLKRLTDAVAADAVASADRLDRQLLDRERDRAIARTIRSLPARLRDPLLLAASGEHRYEDIATMLRIPLGTLKWRISEARRLVRLKLDRLGYGEAR